MDARLFFADVRWASSRLEDVDRLIETQGEDWKESKGTAPKLVSDPTSTSAIRHISAVEGLLEERASLVSLIDEASEIIAGVGSVLGTLPMQVLHAYYIECMTWELVSESLSISRRHCITLRDTALEWVDTVGFAHAKEGTGIAEV